MTAGKSGNGKGDRAEGNGSSSSSSSSGDGTGGGSGGIKMSLLGFVPGAFGGVCNVFVGHPADLVKVRQQCSPPSSSSAPASFGAASSCSSIPPAPPGTAVALHRPSSHNRIPTSSLQGRGVTAPASSSAAAVAAVQQAAGAAGGGGGGGSGGGSRAAVSSLSTAGAAALRAPPPTAAASAAASAVNATSCSSTSTAGIIRQILRREGPRGLYAGVTAPLLAVVPAYGVAFWTFDVAGSLFNREGNGGQGGKQQQQLTVGQTAIAGGVSGIPVALFLGPLEKVKCEVQMMNRGGGNGGLAACLRESYRRGGIANVFRGTGVTMVRDVPGNAAFFATYEVLKRTLGRLESGSGDASSSEGRNSAPPPSTAATLAAGGLAGMANWVVAIPADVVKSRWQVSAPGAYKSPVEVLSRLLQTEGPKALFRGLGPALLRAVPANAAGLLGVETARDIINRQFG